VKISSFEHPHRLINPKDALAMGYILDSVNGCLELFAQNDPGHSGLTPTLQRQRPLSTTTPASRALQALQNLSPVATMDALQMQIFAALTVSSRGIIHHRLARSCRNIRSPTLMDYLITRDPSTLPSKRQKFQYTSRGEIMQAVSQSWHAASARAETRQSKASQGGDWV
jgi:hypothetical protein